MTQAKQKIVIVTGANCGVGYGICQRLLEMGEDLKLIMACRNLDKANKARECLLEQYPFGDIEIEQLDVGSAKSVFNFCASINHKYTYIDCLFCNAGILDSTGLYWKKIFYMLFFDTVALIERADVTIQVAGEINADGLGKIFATNVFGHYMIIREIETLLSNSGEGRIVWTSSITADSKYFDIQDWQGIKTKEPYESSKWATDLISIRSTERFKQENKKITSFSASPGVVASEIGNLPRWIIMARFVLHYVYRLCGVESQNITVYNGALAEVFAAFQSLAVLNYLYRYSSLTTRFGYNYVKGVPIENYDPNVAQQLTTHCELNYQSFKKIYKVEPTSAPAN